MMLPVLIAALAAALPVQAQTTQPTPSAETLRTASPAEATLVSAAWLALARGDVATASARVAELAQEFPRSTNRLWLDIEINLARGGVSAALDGYEQWLAGHTAEEPLALRRIAVAALFETASKTTTPTARLDALSALAADGDARAHELLRAAAASGSLDGARTLAASGDPAGVKQVTAALAGPAPNKIALIDALVASKSAEAIPALVVMLNDPRPEHQAAAAGALGQLGARDQISRLQALLRTPNAPPYVKIAAAGALFRLDDNSGMDQLQAWMVSEVPAMRAAAAKSLAARPDAAWTATVRDLTKAADPLVRLDAARMLAPYDPEAARAALAQLAQDPNNTVRDLANQTAATILPADLTQLKALLRLGDVVRVQAAQRVLEMTR